MRPCRVASPTCLAGSAGACLALFAIACGAVHAQEAEAPAVAPETGRPLWMPRPSRFLDRPMTEAEYKHCRQRTDIPKRGPHPRPASDVPPAPRCLLEEAVSVEVNGTVVDALKAVMGQSKREWLVSIRGDSADEVAQFAAKDAPLWRVLDRLLEVYGYDWGFAHGAVVCWPAFLPDRPRPERPGKTPDEDAATEGPAPPLEIAVPTLIDSVIDNFRPVRSKGPSDLNIVHMGRRVAVDVRLRDWKLAGRMPGDDPARSIEQVAAALSAVIQGTPQEGVISMGAHLWLDRAIRGADSLAADMKAQGVDPTDPVRCRTLLKDRLSAVITAQQWALMDLGGQALIWFRELPLDVATLWVITARAGEARWAKAQVAGQNLALDWSRPEDFFVMAYYADDVQKSPDDGLYRVVGRHPGVAATVPMKGGGGRGL